jgi:hypothetical protein
MINGFYSLRADYNDKGHLRETTRFRDFGTIFDITFIPQYPELQFFNSVIPVIIVGVIRPPAPRCLPSRGPSDATGLYVRPRACTGCCGLSFQEKVRCA